MTARKKSRRVNLGQVCGPEIVSSSCDGVVLSIKPIAIRDQHRGARFTINWFSIRNLVSELRTRAKSEANNLRERAFSIESSTNP